MIVATWLLFTLGCLGALDILLFHSIAHDLRRHAPSRVELMSHAMRGPVYALLFVLVPNVRMQGTWFWGLVGILVLDLLVSLWDFSIEKASRRALGGLPSGEYVLHSVIAMFFGAFVMAVLWETEGWATQETALTWTPDAVADPLRLLLAVMAGGVLLSGWLDARAVWRLAAQR